MNIVQTRNKIQMYGMLDVDVNFLKPANSVRSIKEEQVQTRVCPKKSMPLFLDKLQHLAEYIMCKLRAPGISPIFKLYLLSGDLCFFSGDRSSDLGRAMSQEIVFLETRSWVHRFITD